MKITGTVFFLSLAAAVISQAVALSARALWMILPGVIIGLIWAFNFWRGTYRTGNLSYLVLMVMVFSGVWMSLSSPLLLASAVLALVAWDLDAFAKQIRPYDPDLGYTPVVRTHLGRLLGVAAAGYLLGLLPLLVKTHLNLPAAVILGGLVFLGLTQAVHFLRNS